MSEELTKEELDWVREEISKIHVGFPSEMLRLLDISGTLLEAHAARDARIEELESRDIVRCTAINLLHESHAAKDKRIKELEALNIKLQDLINLDDPEHES